MSIIDNRNVKYKPPRVSGTISENDVALPISMSHLKLLTISLQSENFVTCRGIPYLWTTNFKLASLITSSVKEAASSLSKWRFPPIILFKTFFFLTVVQ